MLIYKKIFTLLKNKGEKMIVLNKEAKSGASSPLNLSPSSSEESSGLSFSELLKGVDLKKDDKLVQNGTLILSLNDTKEELKPLESNPKVDALMALLKNSDESSKKVETEPLALNPKLTKEMDAKEIKSLIADAKEYLKSKILQSDEYKLSQAKELPKTLKGLAEVAKTIGIDISKITLENVQPKGDTSKVAMQSIQTSSLEIKEEHKSTTPETKNSLKAEATEIKPSGVKTLPQGSEKAQIQSKEFKHTDDLKQVPIKDEKITATAQEIRSTPLFKAQKGTSELTTEQLVQTKASGVLKPEEKTPKQKADETLKLLLRGEKPQQSSLNLTADFSVATAKVIAPSATTEASKTLEALLRGDADGKADTQTTSKVDGLQVAKADSFEVKLNEAKQMVKYLSSDVKNAIEEYKSPFTRVKVQLNPQRLGEIDLTIVQRGKNLHVNLSSNNAAINTLSMNANELRAQLNNNGINNATLNFNSNSDGSGSFNNNGQQNGNEARKEYENFQSFENEEINEEIVSSLEIIVPRYI